MKRHSIVLLPLLLLFVSPTAARAADPITELTVVHGGSASVQCPATFTKYFLDLNHGAGGDFIYLCFKRGVGAPLTGLMVTVTANPVRQSPDPGWTLVPVDLNFNAGGPFIYVYYTKYPGKTGDPSKEPNCRTVRDIIVLVDGAPVPDGYVRLPSDLNEGSDKHDHSLRFAVLEE